MGNKNVRTRTVEQFVEENPYMTDLFESSKMDFDPNDLDQNEVEILNQFFSDLCLDLTIYMDMFANEDNFKELIEFSGIIFKRLEGMCLERISLKFSTLMDPIKSCGSENLSLKRFVEKSKSKKLSAMFDELKEFYEKSGIKEWRNKVIAHSDLETFSGKSTVTLNCTRNEIENFVVQMVEFQDFLNSPEVATDHKVTLPFDKDVNWLIHKVKKINEGES